MKLHKTLTIIVIFFLIMSIVLGICTRNSYKYYDSHIAMVKLNPNISDDLISDITAKNLLAELDNQDVILIVSIINNKNIHQGTKTTATVNKVIKGNLDITGTQIIIYEPNFMYYNKATNKYEYYYVNNINNLMQPGKEYLVFLDEIHYSKAYTETLERKEFKVDIDLQLYSFPLYKSIEFINKNNKEDLTYNDVRNYDYFCYNEKKKTKLESLINTILDTYNT